MSTQSEPVHLVSVNTTRLVARALLATTIEEVKTDYNLVNVANSKTIEGVETMLLSLTVPPQLLICSSQWTPEQQVEIQLIATTTQREITNVVIAGMESNTCFEATPRYAYDRGYHVTMLRDCTAAFDPPAMKAASQMIWKRFANVFATFGEWAAGCRAGGEVDRKSSQSMFLGKQSETEVYLS